MVAFIDLTNKIFGKLMVIKRIDKPENRKSHSVFWLCKCECGNEIISDSHHLLQNKINSCGCDSTEPKRIDGCEDLTNQKFGRLTAIEKKENYHLGGAQWLCKCDCGNEKIIRATSLKSGAIKSCGCIKDEICQNLQIDLIGKTFGILTVIEKAGKNKWGSNLWKCQCACGNIKVVIRRTLVNGATKSCGCLQKSIVSEKNSIEFGQATKNTLFYIYKQGAKARNIEFNLEKNYFLSLTSQNCHYCGKEPLQIIKNICNNGDYIYNGIDRVDNNKGYIFGNVVSCCGTCNKAKMIMSTDEFLSWIERVYNHSVKNKGDAIS
jgi:hypothetical protein